MEDFRNLRETRELQRSKDLGEIVHLLTCDPPYKVRHQQELQNSDLNVVKAKTMDAFCGFSEYVLKCKSTKFNFFSVQHTSLWRGFRARMGQVKNCVGEIIVSEVEQKPLFFSREHSYYLQGPRLKRLRHANVVKQAIYFSVTYCPSVSAFTRLLRRAWRH